MSFPGERRLAAIMFTDMVGYSAQVGDNEAQALDVLDAHNAVLSETIAEYHGKVVKTVGDAFFAEFHSTVEACLCGLAIQTRVAEYNQNRPPHEQFQIRIGIHVGDVVVQNGDLFGDGVNIAARIESMAVPGGVAVSEDVARQVDGKLAHGLVDAGQHSLKNIRSQVRIYHLVMPWESTRPTWLASVWARLYYLKKHKWLLRASPLLLLTLMQVAGPHGMRLVHWAGGRLRFAGPGVEPDLPDRGLIFFVSNRGGDFRVYKYLADYRETTAVTSGPNDELPSCSPVSAQIVYQKTDAQQHTNVWMYDDSAGTEQQLTSDPVWAGEPCWSADGQAVFYVSKSSGQRRLCRLDLAGGQATSLGDLGGPVESPACSAKSQRLAFVLTYQGQRQVYLTDPAKPVADHPLDLKLPDGPVHLQWRMSDGALIVGTSSGTTVFNAWGQVEPQPVLSQKDVVAASWSPRSHYVFEKVAGPNSADIMVYHVRALRDAQPVDISNSPGINKDPVWAPPPSGPMGPGGPGGPGGGPPP